MRPVEEEPDARRNAQSRAITANHLSRPDPKAGERKARQISDDFRGKTVHALGVLENGFVFMADLVRALEPPLVCTFIKPQYIQK